MTQNDIDTKVSQANGRLRYAKVGISIERKGDRLYLRGIFPPKPNSQASTDYQQRLALSIHANPHGLKLAEAYHQ